MNWFRSVLIVVMLFAASSHTLAQQTLRYNLEYTCNKERVIVGHCRRDSDQPGFPRTTDEDNYCSVIYPDRPHRGGLEVETVELRSDIINKLAACGAFQERQSSLPRAPSGSAATDEIMSPEVAAAYAFVVKGIELLTSNPAEANKNFDAAIVKFKSAIARGSDLYYAYRGLGITYNSQQKFDVAVPVWKKVLLLKPGDADDLNHLGIAWLELKQYPEAIAAFDRAVKLNPKYATFHLNLGTAYARSGRFDDARREATTLSTLDPARQSTLAKRITAYEQQGVNKNQTSGKGNGTPANSSAASANVTVNPVAVEHYTKGKAFYEAEDYTKAITEFETAIVMKVDKNRLLDAYIYLGDSYNFTRQYPKAIAAMLTAVGLNNDAPYYDILGNAYERTMQFPKALAAYKQAVRLDPKSGLFLSHLGADYVLNGRKAEAKQVYDTLLPIDKDNAKYLLEDIETENGPAGLLVKRAQLGLIGRNEDEALEWFHNALRLNPTNTDLMFDIGSGLDICGKHDEALVIYRRILALKSDAKTLGTAHYFIGQSYNETKNYPRALPELIEANRLNPDYFAKRELGITYTNLKQLPNALKAYQEALKLKPNDVNVQFLIGTTYGEMGNVNEAVATFQELIRLDPKSALGWVEIGKVYLATKRYPDAGRAYSTALRIDPKNKLALFGIGQTYLAIGRKPEAMRAYSALKPLDEKLAQELLNAINGR